jgi:hypothetical protein
MILVVSWQLRNVDEAWGKLKDGARADWLRAGEPEAGCQVSRRDLDSMLLGKFVECLNA